MNGAERPQRFCPQCPASLMARSAFAGVLIDLCPRCRAIWLDDGLLQELVNRFGEGEVRLDAEGVRRGRAALAQGRENLDTISASEARRAKALLCPICQSICFPTIYGFESGVIINRCVEGHGVFLDPGELEAVLLYSSRFLNDSRVSSSGRLSTVGETIALDPEGLENSLHESDHRHEAESSKAASSKTSGAQPRLGTARHLRQPIPVDVRLTVNREGAVTFLAIRSPQGAWYKVRDRGTAPLPHDGGEARDFWVELENGGALVLRHRDLRFSWVLVGAGPPRAIRARESKSS